MKNKKVVTVFTPTYNRAHTLTRLYMSLLNQTNKNFTWMVVDGNSSDNTDELITNMQRDGAIDIEYYKNPRRSKYSAILDFATNAPVSELVFFVDSDDYVSADAIEQLEEYYYEIKDNQEIAGFLFLCSYPKSNFSIKPLKDKALTSYVDLQIERKDSVDTCCQIYKAEVLKKTKFNDFREDFMPESLLWNTIDKKHKMMTVNKTIYYREYENDGYTISGRWRNLKSPKGAREAKRMLLERKLPVLYFLKTILLYDTYSIFARINFHRIIRESPHRFLSFVIYPFAITTYLIWKKNP